MLTIDAFKEVLSYLTYYIAHITSCVFGSCFAHKDTANCNCKYGAMIRMICYLKILEFLLCYKKLSHTPSDHIHALFKQNVYLMHCINYFFREGNPPHNTLCNGNWCLIAGLTYLTVSVSQWQVFVPECNNLDTR